MEADTDKKKNWKLKKINKCWFLDVGGKLTRMNILNYATDVHMEDNIIFADDLVVQLTEESDGEITLTEINDICQKVNTSDYKDKETVDKSEKEESGARNSANKKDYEECLKKEGDQNEDIAHDTPLTNQNRSSRAELTLVEDPEYLYGDDEGQEADQELGSEEYVPKKGKFRGFFERVKQIVRKKSALKQKEEPLYDVISNTSKEFTSVNSDNGDGDEESYDYTLFEPMKVQSASSDAVPGARRVTALFDFNQFSEDELSFKKRDRLKLKLGGETISDFTDNYDWCLAEHLTTGKKGYIPLAYVTENIHTLKAQSWWFDISRQEAIDLLKMPGSAPGTYLVRPSKSEHGRIVLSLLAMDSNVVHYRIKSENGRLFIARSRSFYDIFELIHFYKCTAEGLLCKLESPAQKQNPFVYSRNLEIKRESVVITKSFRCGDYGELFIGKFSNTVDVTIVTKFKLTVDKFLAEAKVLHNFRQSKRFVRVFGVIINPEPFMIILGETVRNTLQQYMRIDGGKTVTFKALLEIAAEIAEGMAFLEKENVVHRHLKSENVFVCDFNQVKIVHPKLSKMMKVRFSDKHCKDENDWQWTAPEAIDDEAMFSTKSDVWSFGVLLYELITFGKVPYAGLIQKDTLGRLHEGFRLSKPKDDPIPCPAAFYVTILKCWHRLPECRPTFHFLEDFFQDFEVAVECEIGLKDSSIQDLYMRGPLQQGSATDTRTNVSVRSLRKPEARLDPQKSESQESTPITSEGSQNVGMTEPTAKNNGKTQVTGGFSVKALNSYEAEADDEISIYPDDIITDVDPVDDAWWIGTVASGLRGKFPSNFVEIFENAYAELTKK